MNLLFLLTPKAACSYVREEDSLRQALERMTLSGYAAIPILNRDGVYLGTLTEGDLLRAMKSLKLTDFREAENYSIMEIPRRRDNEPVSANTNVEDLRGMLLDQNFIPVVDDKDTFIGLVTRKSLMQYYLRQYDAAVKRLTTTA